MITRQSTRILTRLDKNFKFYYVVNAFGRSKKFDTKAEADAYRQGLIDCDRGRVGL
jgi:hypothetical protein